MARLLEVPVDRSGKISTLFINPLSVQSVSRIGDSRTLVELSGVKVIVADGLENVLLAINEAANAVY